MFRPPLSADGRFTPLSRRQQGFESPWGRQLFQLVVTHPLTSSVYVRQKYGMDATERRWTAQAANGLTSGAVREICDRPRDASRRCYSALTRVRSPGGGRSRRAGDPGPCSPSADPQDRTSLVCDLPPTTMDTASGGWLPAEHAGDADAIGTAFRRFAGRALGAARRGALDLRNIRRR